MGAYRPLWSSDNLTFADEQGWDVCQKYACVCVSVSSPNKKACERAADREHLTRLCTWIRRTDDVTLFYDSQIWALCNAEHETLFSHTHSVPFPLYYFYSEKKKKKTHCTRLTHLACLCRPGCVRTADTQKGVGQKGGRNSEAVLAFQAGWESSQRRRSSITHYLMKFFSKISCSFVLLAAALFTKREASEGLNQRRTTLLGYARF